MYIKGIYLLAAEMFERSSLRGFSQQMLASYIASINVANELPGRALLLKSKLEMQNYNNHEALQVYTSKGRVAALLKGRFVALLMVVRAAERPYKKAASRPSQWYILII